jgi:hypothetical protein
MAAARIGGAPEDEPAERPDRGEGGQRRRDDDAGALHLVEQDDMGFKKG